MLVALSSSRLLDLTFDQWFLLRRRSKGLTQDQIASALGVSAQTISNWEKARSVPSLTIKQVRDLCNILDCSLADIPVSD